MKMLDSSFTEGGTRRRSTFYVPLTDNPLNNQQDSTKNSALKKLEKSNLTVFSPFRRIAKKSPTPPVQEEPEKRPIQSSAHSKPSRTSIQPALIRPKVERHLGKIGHLQHPQKPKTSDASRLLKTPSGSVPSLDNSFSLPKAEVKSASSTQSLETLRLSEARRSSGKSSNFFSRKTDLIKVVRSPSQRVLSDSTKRVTIADVDSSSVPTISALMTPPKKPNRHVKVPQLYVESEDTDDSTTLHETDRNRRGEDDDAAVHSGEFHYS